MTKPLSSLWRRLRGFFVWLHGRSRRWKFGMAVVVLLVTFIAGVWFPFAPRPPSPAQPTACWQPDPSPSGAPVVSHFLPINDNDDALSWRLALIDSAKRRIDAQYFMWHMDEIGLLLLERLLQAADRGIKVRLLLDDIMGGLDREWILANSHPNLEVRLFNPFRTRGNNWLARAPEWLINISRLNYRMHNKLFLIDQNIGIIGGRNISNEYFGLGSDLDYRDFDLLAAGPVAYQLDESFETFWNSVWTYPPTRINTLRAGKGDLADFRQETRRWLATSDRLEAALSGSLDAKTLFAQAEQKSVRAVAEVIYDCPPGTRANMPVQRVVARFRDVLDGTRKELFLVSPYVVLSSSVRDHLYAAFERGVQVRLLTNSLQASDQSITFSAYAKRRQEFLSRGMIIHELMAQSEQWQRYRTPRSSGEYLSIHAKLVLFDDDKLMIGSLNLDPRSKYLNTEIALLIRSRELADVIMGHFEPDLDAANSWRVGLDESGRMFWLAGDGRIHEEPARSLLQRLQVFLYSFLPVDRQL